MLFLTKMQLFKLIHKSELRKFIAVLFCFLLN